MFSFEGVSSCDQLCPLPDDAEVLQRSVAQSEMKTTGSSSGSGDSLEPTDIEPVSTPDYDTKSFISLTFTNLTSQHYAFFFEQLEPLLIRLLELNFSPLIAFEGSSMSTSTVVVYFPVATSQNTLDFYVTILSTVDDAEWSDFSSSYVSSCGFGNTGYICAYFSGFGCS